MWNYRRLKPKPFLRWALVIGALLLHPVAVSHAQDMYAAALQVFHPGVEVRRAGTAAWLPLPQDALTTFGAGDQVRTNAAGRVRLTFEDDAVVLVMPDTTYELAAFVVHNRRVEQLHARLTGRIVQQTQGTIRDYALETPRLTVRRPASLFISQTQGDTITYLITAQGEAQAEIQGQTITLAAGQGLRVVDTLVERVPLPPPLRLSELAIPADACHGLVAASPEPSVEVRTGPGEDYRSVGRQPNGTTIAVLGISESKHRYLTQFKNGFGWVLAIGIDTDCAALPTVRPDSVFPLGGVVNLQTSEQPLLTPFFGLPEDDRWFYSYD